MGPFYTGWEHLSRLSHFPLACRGSPWKLKRVVEALPALLYVALTHFYGSDRDDYIDFGRREAWGVHFVIMALYTKFATGRSGATWGQGKFLGFGRGRGREASSRRGVLDPLPAIYFRFNHLHLGEEFNG